MLLVGEKQVPVTRTPGYAGERGGAGGGAEEEEDGGVHDVESFLEAVHDEAAAFEARLRAMM